MPVFNNPRQAIIVEGGGSLGVPLALAGVLAAIVALVAFVLAHLILLAVCTVVLAVATLGIVQVLKRYTVVVHGEVPVQRPVTLTATTVRQAIPASRPAIAPTQHLHLHFHGVSAEDAATIISRREIQS